MQEKKLIKEIVCEHQSLFALSFKAGQMKVSPVTLTFNEPIDTVKPIISKVRPLSHKELAVVQEWITSSLKAGIIEPSSSTWRSTVFPVRKPDKVDSSGKRSEQWRLVTPFYQLNKLLNINATPMPNIQDVRQAVAGSELFSVVDLTQSFFQIPLAPESRPYTAFGATGTRLYQYKTVPMGCTISTGLLQSALTTILSDFYFAGCIVYCDDILVYSPQPKERHMKLFHAILDKLKEAGEFLKSRNCKLLTKE